MEHPFEILLLASFGILLSMMLVMWSNWVLKIVFYFQYLVLLGMYRSLSDFTTSYFSIPKEWGYLPAVCDMSFSFFRVVYFLDRLRVKSSNTLFILICAAFRFRESRSRSRERRRSRSPRDRFRWCSMRRIYLQLISLSWHVNTHGLLFCTTEPSDGHCVNIFDVCWTKYWWLQYTV